MTRHYTLLLLISLMVFTSAVILCVAYALTRPSDLNTFIRIEIVKMCALAGE